MKLDERALLSFDWLWFLALLLLVTSGILCIWSSTPGTGLDSYFGRQLLYLGIGLLIFVVLLYFVYLLVTDYVVVLYIAGMLVLVLVLVAGTGAVSVAQRFGVIEGVGAGIRVPPPDFNDGGFTVCKWMFRSDRSEPSGVGWSTDYPFGEINLLIRLSELTRIHVSRDRRGEAIRKTQYTIAEVKQVPSIFSWGGPGSDPRERGSDSPHANFRAIADGHGRVMVAMTHNTDIGDSMEREGDNPDYFAEYSPEGYALATNIVLYALTH